MQPTKPYDGVSELDEAAWSEEIKRRMAEIEVGAIELIPWKKYARNCSDSPVEGRR